MEKTLYAKAELVYEKIRFTHKRLAKGSCLVRCDRHCSILKQVAWKGIWGVNCSFLVEKTRLAKAERVSEKIRFTPKRLAKRSCLERGDRLCEIQK